MKVSALLAVTALVIDSVCGHYIFQQIGVGGTKHALWKYVRKNSNPSWLQNGPVTDLSSKDLRCNVGGLTSNGTETLTVKAGDSFTFYLDTAVYHVGPTSLYMSKAPGLAADYDGSGQWFKFNDWGPSGTNWNLANAYTSNIPKCIPDGEYLRMYWMRRYPRPSAISGGAPRVRIQQLGIHNPGAAPQFYISCAQVKVTGGGSTTPSPTVSIPGAFKASDPGFTANVYAGGASNYVVPGPKVFKC